MTEDINENNLNDILLSLERFRESFRLGSFIIQPQVLHFSRMLEVKPKPRPLRFHTHRTYELSTIMSGEVAYRFEPKDIIIRPGDLIIIPPDCRHRLEPVQDSLIASFMLFISCPGEGSRAEMEKLHGAIEQHDYHLRELKPVEQFLRQVIAEAQSPAIGWEDSILYLTRMAYITVFRNLLPGMKTEYCRRNLPPQRGNKHRAVIELVRFFAVDNIFRWIEVGEVCSHIGLSQAYLNRIFKEYEGVTVSRYLLDLRMFVARKMLQDTDRPLKDISGAVGFHDFGHFCRVFKKLTGMTPSEFRRNNG